MARPQFLFLLLLSLSFLALAGALFETLFGKTTKSLKSEDLSHGYGVDCSFPIHHYLDPMSASPTRRLWAERYDKMIKGCVGKYSQRECEGNERARIEMNLNQPRTQHNYTTVGFKKMEIPPELWHDIKVFWEDNSDKERVENWPRGNTYVNHWDSPSMMVSTGERSRLQQSLHERVVTVMQTVLEEWVQTPLTYTSLYGIRVYKHGAILSTHVDRLPLVTSAILQVSQDVDTPWPVEVYSHDGQAHNVTMLPGEMVLYESHTVLHGRPFALNGRHYANIFVHFVPVAHDANNAADAAVGKVAPIPVEADWAQQAKKQRTAEQGREHVGHEAANHDDVVLSRHMREHEEGGAGKGFQDRLQGRPMAAVDGQTALHRAAGQGQLEVVEQLLQQSQDLLHARDANDWQPIHEAARGGHVDVLKYLVELGADFSARTSNGGTPLFWARARLPSDHPCIQYLEGIGAPDSEDVREKE